MKTLDAILDRVRGKKQSAEAEYLDLLKRQDQPQAGDDVRLEELMQVLTLTPDEVKADGDAVRDALELSSVVSTRPDVEAKHRDAEKQFDSYAEETGRIIRERQTRLAELDDARRRARGPVDQCIRAAEQLRQLAYKHRKSRIRPAIPYTEE